MMDPLDPRHGTYAGAAVHWKEGDRPCSSCAVAAARKRKWNNYLTLVGTPATVPSIGTVRRIQALQALGWTHAQIADAADLTVECIRSPICRGTNVYRSTAEGVAEAYDALAMKVAPDSRNARWCRTFARRKGWPPPLAWDDIDDPNEVPRGLKVERGHLRESFDHVIVERVLGGEFNLPTTTAEKAEVCRSWVARGGQISDLAALTGWRTDRYYTSREVA